MHLWVTRDGNVNYPEPEDRYDVWSKEPTWSVHLWEHDDDDACFWSGPCSETLEHLLKFKLRPGQCQKIEVPFSRIRRIGPLIDKKST